MVNRLLQRRRVGARFWSAVGCLLFGVATRLHAQSDESITSQGDLVAIRPLAVSPAGKTGFTRLPSTTTGIHFTNSVSSARSLTNHILLNGSGVAAGDVNGDGRCDLYVCGLDGPNALYLNRGNWSFEDVAAKAGVDCPDLDATGAALVDLDGDGDLDLLVSAIRGGVRCYINDGTAHFQDVTDAWNLRGTTGGMTLALADIDGDGDLDLYLCNYRNETLRDGFQMQIRVGMVQGQRVVTRVNGHALVGPDLAGWVTLDADGNIQENGQADWIYLNNAGQGFRREALTDGRFLDLQGRPIKSPLFDWSLSAQFRDINRDGLPDLYVCSDMASPDRIWINHGNGQFMEAPPEMFRKTSWFSMGIDFGDLDRDGADDAFVTDMLSREHRLRQRQVSDHQPVFSQPGRYQDRPQTPRNTLFRNRGDGTFAEIAYASGLHASDWSWSPLFLDVDLDGYEDILVTTGFERDVQDADIANELERARRERRLTDAQALALREQFPKLAQPNLAFHNLGNFHFSETGRDWGLDEPGVAQGAALADLDGDGDLDLVINNMNAALSVYRNDSAAGRLAVRLRGASPNTAGIGARIEVRGGNLPQQSQELQAGGRYLSSDEAVRVFATGGSTNRFDVKVTWRSGRTTTATNVPTNSRLTLSEPTPPLPGALASPTPAQSPAPTRLFVDATPQLGHVHLEPGSDDFARQPLLPRKQSQLGPGAAWYDLNGDGWDDLILGTGRGGRVGFLRQDGQGHWSPWNAATNLRSEPIATTALLALPVATNSVRVVAGLAAEPETTQPTGTMRVFEGTPLAATQLSGAPVIHGPLAAADVDGDGILDVFAGIRSNAGRYPLSEGSHLYQNLPGLPRSTNALAALVETIGRVHGAVFSDLDGDGTPELVLATDWGGIRVLKKQVTTWIETEQPLRWPDSSPMRGRAPTLHQLSGWWNGIAAGDFDGDGRMDLIASNWGRNTRYEERRDHPQRLYYGEFSGPGHLDVIESFFDTARGMWVPWMHLGRVGAAIPDVAQRFPTFRAFAEASLPQILGAGADKTPYLEAHWFESTVFLNKPNGFIPLPLPEEAQWSPAFGIAIADFDGDGRDDVFLSQNFFATEPETARYDAGRGLVLRGDGTGGFQAMRSTDSGVAIDGEGRAAAVCDFDKDGRPDLVVTQNGAATRLLKNATGKPGLRVRMVGPPGNPLAFGAQVRLRFGEKSGPTRELHAGGGYLSQDSATLVLATPEIPTSVEVLWPGGKRSSTPIPMKATEVIVVFPQKN